MPALAAVLKLDNILVATDFSPASKLATRFAIEIARQHRAKLLMVHVAGSQSERPLMDAWRAGQSEIMDHFIAGRLTGIEHELLVKPGDVWGVLSELIPERAIDLIVAGTRGRTGMWKFFMGSVAERIFRLAPCPVLIVGPSSSQEPEAGPRRILVPTGFAHQSLYAVRYAVWLAEQLRSALAVLHVVTEAGQLPAQEKERIRNERLKRLRALIPESAGLADTAEFLVEFGAATDQILGTCAAWNPNLVVLGLRPTGEEPPPETAQTKAYDIICKAPCPVLTVREPV
ncbi:MAG TPA: universal stress protein [Terriglobales bacterium]|jgi:nucleotide-binding universal stress UspA family protein|nr:universal stress protein [Terriglobales bacterium]